MKQPKIPRMLLKRNHPPIVDGVPITTKPVMNISIEGQGRPHNFRPKFFRKNEPPKPIDFYYENE